MPGGNGAGAEASAALANGIETELIKAVAARGNEW